MSLLPFLKKKETAAPSTGSPALEAFLKGYSIEVMPRTAEKVEDLRELLPKGTRVYIANIEFPIEDMVATAKRLRDEGFEPMPHFTARIIKDKAMLADWLARYQGEAGVCEGLIIAGELARDDVHVEPAGAQPRELLLRQQSDGFAGGGPLLSDVVIDERVRRTTAERRQRQRRDEGRHPESEGVLEDRHVAYSTRGPRRSRLVGRSRIRIILGR